MINIPKLSPFKHFCMTIGNIPTTYEESLSYYEMLEWLCKYLNKEVIPAVNTNAEAVSELQNFLEHYFDNLDVQEEINNKLDEMAQSGQLEEIITNYIQLKGVLSFDTINNMKNASNLIEGSIVKTLGKNRYNDCKGNFYKIRTLVNTDTVDNVNIISLTNYPSLIAELIPSLGNRNRYILIGDSYVTGTLNGVQYSTDGWAKRLKDNLGLSDEECYIYGDGGSGFTAEGHEGYTFITLLSSNINNILFKDSITHIVVCGGFNDQYASGNNIRLAISNFVNIAKENFPNAKVYIGCISTSSEISLNGRQTRTRINHTVLPNYKRCIDYNAIYLNGVESILKDYSLMGTDYFHPNIDGYNELSHGIFQAIESGYYSKVTDVKADTVTALSSGVILSGTQSFQMYSKVTDNQLLIHIFGRLLFSDSAPIRLNVFADQKICHINSTLIRKNYGVDLYLTPMYVTFGESNLGAICYLYIDDDNDLVLHILKLLDGSTATTANKMNILVENIFSIND